MNGADYNGVSNYVVIPAGSFNANITVTPRDDSLAEGEEAVSLTLFDSSGYNAGSVTNVVVIISDDETSPLPFALKIASTDKNVFRLTLTGPATRLYNIDVANELNSWRPWTQLVNSNGSTEILDSMDTNHLFFRARMEQ